MARYPLDDGELLHAAHPTTFEIPPREARETLRVGSYAKLIFRGPEGGDRMWVEVTEVHGHGAATRYVGRLDTSAMEGLPRDARVAFAPRHVIDTMVLPSKGVVLLAKVAFYGLLGYGLYRWLAPPAPTAPAPAFRTLRPGDTVYVDPDRGVASDLGYGAQVTHQNPDGTDGGIQTSTTPLGLPRQIGRPVTFSDADVVAPVPSKVEARALQAALKAKTQACFRPQDRG